MPTYSGTLNLSASIRGCALPEILDFSLEVEDYTSASGSLWVDIVDYYLPIDLNNTYFVVNGVVVSGTFSVITVSGVTASGTAYRMSYDPLDDFNSLLGSTCFNVHVENDCERISEANYYLTFGYKVDFENEVNNYIDFGYDSQVLVRVLAENSASCTKESGYAYWFSTIHDTSIPLYDGPDYINGNVIFPAQIISVIPDEAYAYGKTMQITIRAKDFSGNEMEPYVLTYKIEEYQ
jgi:hypothetical protein